MVTNHRKKSSRHRGSWTHGTGEKKKHRGAGSRGGRGNAGSGTRGDAKKPSYWKKEHLKGKFGFKNPNAKTLNVISISKLNTSVDKLLSSGMITKSGEKFVVKLTDLGVDKLLGTGNPAFAYEIYVKTATPGAIEKVKSMGGLVSLVASSTEEKTEETKAK